MEKESGGCLSLTVTAWSTGDTVDNVQPVEVFSELLWYPLVLEEANTLSQAK